MNQDSTRIERFYKAYEGTIQLLILIVIPLGIFLFGNYVTNSVESAKSQQEYVRIATGILAQEVKSESNQVPIRTWAADVLQKFSPVSMNLNQRDSLISGESRLSVGYGTDWGYTNYGTTYDTKTPSDQSRPEPADE